MSTEIKITLSDKEACFLLEVFKRVLLLVPLPQVIKGMQLITDKIVSGITASENEGSEVGNP